ncbi:hypothetical protein C4566_00615 [Candidatus Parcubacteria bacterium]|nr:MAG: hypothetical protein C4566_00615 [Candidatus Parcubacteria bacterium]
MTKDKEIKFEQPSEILIIVNRYVMIIMAVIILGILALGYFFLLSPKIASIKVIEQETTDIEQRRILNENLLTKIKQLQFEYDGLIEDREGQLSKLLKVIPDEPQLAELFVLTERLAKQRGFELQSINISEGSTSSGSVNPDGSSAVVSEEGLKSLVIHANIAYGSEAVEGDKKQSSDEEEVKTPYQIFKQYLVDLENNLRLMDVQAVSFGSLDPTLEGAVSFSFDIITYYK